MPGKALQRSTVPVPFQTPFLAVPETRRIETYAVEPLELLNVAYA